MIGVMPPDFEMLMPADHGVPEGLEAWLPWGGGYGELSRGFRAHKGYDGALEPLVRDTEKLASWFRGLK